MTNFLSLDDLAGALRGAEETRVAISPPTTTHPELTLAGAYAVQTANIRSRVSAGERIVGRKIGLTSLAMQKQLGVDQPDYGVLTDAMVIQSGGLIDLATLLAPRVEPEFAFRIGVDLPVSPSLDELRDAIDGVSTALEVIDSRVADWKIGLLDTVADNASSARVVFGSFVPASPDLLAALPDAVVAMHRDDVVVGEGPGSAVLGDPLLSVRWLATAIGRFGDFLRAGDLVLAGAVAAAVPLVPGSTWTASSDGMPSAVLRTVSSKEAR